MALLQISEPNQAPDPHARRIAIGIDLGTTHSLVASVRSGVAECLPDEQGRVILPSVVRYLKDEAGADKREIGYAALDAQVSDPANTIASVKRLMGRGLADVASADSLPYRLIAKGGMVAIDTVAGEKSPVEVSAEILATLRYRAEDTFDDDIFGAVITVPAYFDDAQRQATKDAAQLAGLNVLRLINEPTAAAIAYGLDNAAEGTFAVYDLGGGTFDISILRLAKGVFEVVATGGDSALGGDDFDWAIVDFVMNAFAESDAIIVAAKFLQGQPIAILTGNEAPQEGYAVLRQWASDLFAKQGGAAIHPTLGAVVLDERAVRDSIGHKMNPYKAAAFTIVKDVIEKGVIVLTATDTKQNSYYIAAPVVIGSEPDIVTVLVHQDVNSSRMYLHSVATKKYLLTRFDSSADAKVETYAEQPSGEAKSRDVASVLHRLLAFNVNEKHGLHLCDTDKAELKKSARAAKESLTSHSQIDFAVNVAGKPIAVSITREQFVAITKPLTDRTMSAVKKALRDAKLKPADIDGTVMVGGSTRMSHIQAVVGDFFGKPPLVNLNPDEVVALGAAIQANQLAGNKTGTDADDMLLLDVIPLSLGIETMGGLVERIVPRNQTIPTAMAQDFTTYKDGQTALALHVVQGERDLVVDCRSLARFELRGIPPMVAGAAKIRVTFTVDADGLLAVSAKELNSGVEAQINVKPSYGLTDEQIAMMLRESFGTAAEDMAARALAEARLESDRMVIAVQSALAADRDLLDATSQAEIDDLVAACIASKSLEDAKLIEAVTEALAKATESFAAARMNAGIARALAGKNIENL